MSIISQYKLPIEEVPGYPGFEAKWHEFITRPTSSIHRRILPNTKDAPGGGGYYDPTTTDVTVLAQKALSWMAFPRDLILPTNRDDRESAFKLADVDRNNLRHPQNEYCEWRVEKQRLRWEVHSRSEQSASNPAGSRH